MLLGVVLLLSTTVMAQPESENASNVKPGITPGNPLYVIESFVERIEVNLAGMMGGPEMKSKAIANNAEERLAEAKYLADRNKTEKAARSMQKYSEGLNQSMQIAKDTKNKNLEEKIQNVSRKNTKNFEEVKNRIPEKAQEALQRKQNKFNDRENPSVQRESKGKNKPSERGIGKTNESNSLKNKTERPINNSVDLKSPNKTSEPIQKPKNYSKTSNKIDNSDITQKSNLSIDKPKSTNDSNKPINNSNSKEDRIKEERKTSNNIEAGSGNLNGSPQNKDPDLMD